MKKIISIFILITLLCTALIGCQEPKENESKETSSTENAKNPYYDESGGYHVTNKFDENWNGKEFRILVVGPVGATYQSDDFVPEARDLYGELISDAVGRRNNKIEENYDVKIVPIKSDTINEDIQKDVAAGTGMYDAAMPYLPTCANFAQENLFVDLRSLNNITLDAPWWDQNANKAFSVGEKLYFTTGDITILNKVCTPSVLFNKEMIKQYNLDNPYKLVEDKKWTFDKMVEMAKAVTVINTSDGSISKDNNYGMLTSYADALAFYGASGQMLCNKDENDKPFLAIDNEKAISVAKTILDTLQQNNWSVFAEKFEEPIWVTSFATFLEGRALFRPSGFSATTKARKQSDIEFGILPLPMFDSTQDNYYSYCSTGCVAGLAIPKTAPDKEFSAFMVDLCAAEAKNTITPAYYEVNLKSRDVTDNESLAMLDIIFSNIVYDVGEVYDFGSVKTMFRELMVNSNPNIASTLEGIKEVINNDIDETLQNYARYE